MMYIIKNQGQTGNQMISISLKETFRDILGIISILSFLSSEKVNF